MDNKFPDGFLWGAATSSHQVEGDNSFNDWWQWEKDGHTEPSGKACDHYHRFREDFLLAKELGHNAHRLGIEWSRLEKDEGVWDQAEWDHYKRVLDELIKLGIEPLVTLNHFTLPLWLARKGGWLNEQSVDLFTRFAAKAIEELGGRTEYWITINEPNILAMLAYFCGQWPPCKKNFSEALVVLKNMLKGHVGAYRRMKEYARSTSGVKSPKIGIAKAVTAFHPCSPFSALDRLFTYCRSRFYNHSFIASAKKKKTLDFIGLNYYFRQFIHHGKPFMKNPLGEVCSLGHHADAGETTDMGWEIYPEGLYEVVKSFSRYQLPIFITENGIATNDDTIRQRYLKDHLTQLLRAIKQGSPVIGYLHWSLMDNFEWAEGYSKRFGLVHVDFGSQKRTIRNSARYYASVIQTGKV
ncbi:glycoside hydrolase family 1 protein [Candidatus Omnitrophota bacterium]